MKKKIILLISIIFMSVNSFSQCAMCKAVVENGDEELAEGLNAGIMFLMAFPYILVLSVLYLIYRYKTRTKN